MAKYISGAGGSVTFASGFVTAAYKWSITPEATLYEDTAFGNYGSSSASSVIIYQMHTRSLGLKRWEGSYNCRQATATTTNIAGHGYETFTYKMDVTITADVLQGTKFTDVYEVNNVVGLFDIEGTAEVYIDDTAALPTAGSTGSFTVTVATGQTYAFTGIMEKDAAEVARDGSGRKVAISFRNSGATLTIIGAVPIPGATGAATFVADGAKQYSGSIAVKSIKLSMDANRTSGDWEIAFVGDGVLTAA